MGLRPVQIDGLSERQVMLCNIIYACDSYDELNDFLKHLDKRDLKDAWTLITLMRHEYIEEEIMSEYIEADYYPDAEDIISKIMGYREDNDSTNT